MQMRAKVYSFIVLYINKLNAWATASFNIYEISQIHQYRTYTTDQVEHY